MDSKPGSHADDGIFPACLHVVKHIDHVVSCDGDIQCMAEILAKGLHLATETLEKPMTSQKRYLRQLLLRRSAWMENWMYERAQKNGYGEVTPAMNRMFGHMGGRPISLSELARRLSISRQAVHQCANTAASLGLVEFSPSELDARVRLLRFTEKGWRMSEQAAHDLDLLETALEARIGYQDLEELKRILSKGWSDDE